MQGDLCGDNAALYLAEAERYSLEKVAAAALPVCAAWLTEDGGGYVTALPSPLFCRVIHAPERKCSSGELSQLVAAYCCGPEGFWQKSRSSGMLQGVVYPHPRSQR